MENLIPILGIVLLVIITIAFIVLVVVAITWICQLVFGIAAGFVEHRRAEARKVIVSVPGVGDFTSYNSGMWMGDVDGFTVHLTTNDEPPNESHVAQIRAVLADLPRLAELCRSYLVDHEDCEWLEGGGARFEPEWLDFIDASNYWLHFGHPADADGNYRVEILDGKAETSTRDD